MRETFPNILLGSMIDSSKTRVYQSSYKISLKNKPISSKQVFGLKLKQNYYLVADPKFLMLFTIRLFYYS